MVRGRHLPLAGDDIQGKVLHRRVEDLLHRAGQAVHLVDEEHVPGAQVGQQGRQVPGLFNGRAAGDAQVDPQLARHDAGQGGLAQARRAVEQHMVQRFLPALGRLDVDFQVLFDFVLANILVKRAGAQGVFHRLVLRGVAGLYHAVFVIPAALQVHLPAIGFHWHIGSSFHLADGHFPLPKLFSARRINSSGGRALSNRPTAAAASLAEYPKVTRAPTA